jgi:hypothetical protein
LGEVVALRRLRKRRDEREEGLGVAEMAEIDIDESPWA